MLPEEAEWIGNEIIEISKSDNKKQMLNVGSSTKYFREVQQPHIQKMIFDRLDENGISVTHLDIKENEGVDIVGDLTDDSFLQEIKKKKYDIILCSNLLEHVLTPQKICDAMLECVDDEGFIIITVPKTFPYHNDPLDTMFRPSPEELHKFFPGSELVKSKVIEFNLTHFKFLMTSAKRFFPFALRTFTPFYKFHNWKKIMKGYPIMFKKFEVTCIIVKKK